MLKATMRAWRHYLAEASTNLWRGWGTSLLSIATIVAAVVVLGAVLLVSATVQRALERWSGAAGLSVYLSGDITAGNRAAVERALRETPGIESVAYVSPRAAARRFAQDFPDLAPLATLPGAPVLPASFDAQLRSGDRGGLDVKAFATRLSRMAGVADVRYDRGLIERLAQAVAFGRGVAGLLVAILVLGAALAVISVVRLSYVARRHEVEILTLVGAPLSAIRGPFVAEGWLQGTLGAAVALGTLAAGFIVLRARYGGGLAAALGLDRIEFLSPLWCVALVVASGALGAWAGAVAVGRRIADIT